jgi:trehalose-6-phosphatase
MTKYVVLCNYFFVYKRTCLSFAGFKHLALLCQQGNDIVVFQPASEYLPLINKVCKILEENTKDIEGAKIEHNLFCASVHFRRVKEEVIL